MVPEQRGASSPVLNTNFDPSSVGVLDVERLLSDRAREISASGIRRVFELGAKLKDPINLSIGQPDFPVPESLKHAAISAIERNANGYSVTQGVPELLGAISQHLQRTLNWNIDGKTTDAIVTSGTSGALHLAFLSLLNPGDEVIIPDPWFVIYPALAKMVGATAIPCDTYPDFRMTAARVERLITTRTRAILVNSPGNPSGCVLSLAELVDLVTLCRSRGILLISDEIYDEFTYSESREHDACPTPASLSQDVLLVRGFGKTYGCTGWRLGFAAGPARLLREMAKFQQYTYVCAPTPMQHGVIASFSEDLSPVVRRFQSRRDRVVAALGGVTSLVVPGGAFYAFIEVPQALRQSATQFVEQAIAQRVLVIPGNVFSSRDTHFRLSFAAPDAKLDEGLAILYDMLSGRRLS